MNPWGLSIRPFLAALLMLAALALGGCAGSSTSSSNSSASPSGETSTGVQLDPAVTLPSDFPSDFPIYQGSRPTQQVALSSNGTSTWQVTWETLDAPDKVQAFYSAQLKQGDWTVTFEGTNSGQYSVTFARKSNANFNGLMSVDNTTKQGVTTVTLVLTSAPS